MLDWIRGFIFIICELFVLLLLFSPFLVTTDEKGAKVFRPLGRVWGRADVLVLAAIFAQA